MPAQQSAAFKKAIEESRQLKQKPTDDELLQLYALFKEGSQDPPIEESKAPGMFELREKAKRNAWQKVHDEGIKPEEAQKRYVKLVTDLKEKYGWANPAG